MAIVYDMQVDVLGQLSDGADTVDRVSAVLTAAKHGGWHEDIRDPGT